MKKTLMFAAIALVAFVGYSCKPKAEAPKAMFEYEIAADDVTTVQFTNLSKNATTYKWEFGDTETSTEVSPKHVYAEGGTYTVKLTADGEGGTNTYVEEISLVAPRVTIDGKFNDWDKLEADKDPQLSIAVRPAEGSYYADRYALIKALVTTDEMFMYYSLEFQSSDPDYVHVQQFDICIDADGNAETGKDRSSYWEGMGMEYLVQYGDEMGKIAAGVEDASPEGIAFWQDWTKYQVFYYAEEKDPVAVDQANDISARVVNGATTRVEGRVMMAYIGGISQSGTFGFKCSDQGWAHTCGQLPTPLEEEGSKVVVPGANFKF